MRRQNDTKTHTVLRGRKKEQGTQNVEQTEEVGQKSDRHRRHRGRSQRGTGEAEGEIKEGKHEKGSSKENLQYQKNQKLDRPRHVPDATGCSCFSE